ncbi:hypothetical protein BD770DRAFT_318778 [Pilaira anomala]|nr:hypothetical protein BD770DRAFT_318778 [Pilaira anomala]
MNRALLFITCTAAVLNTVFALTADDISECPSIDWHRSPKSVHDLKADDIEVIAAMGDRYDEDAPSLANYFQEYQPDLYGPSFGKRPARLCPGTFFCLGSQHDLSIDVLNAAQSGATSNELTEQVDYLTEQIGLDTEYATSWKLINLFIGFNDASISCLPNRTVAQYKANVKNSLIRLFEKVDNAFVNLVGIMEYNDLIYTTDQAPGYKKHFENNTIDLLDYECFCCRHPNGGVKFIGDIVKEYNIALSQIAEELSASYSKDGISPYLRKSQRDVTVVYQPMNPVISTVPPQSLR